MAPSGGLCNTYYNCVTKVRGDTRGYNQKPKEDRHATENLSIEEPLWWQHKDNYFILLHFTSSYSISFHSFFLKINSSAGPAAHGERRHTQTALPQCLVCCRKWGYCACFSQGRLWEEYMKPVSLRGSSSTQWSLLHYRRYTCKQIIRWRTKMLKSKVFRGLGEAQRMKLLPSWARGAGVVKIQFKYMMSLGFRHVNVKISVF